MRSPAALLGLPIQALVTHNQPIPWLQLSEFWHLKDFEHGLVVGDRRADCNSYSLSKIVFVSLDLSYLVSLVQADGGGGAGGRDIFRHTLGTL